MNMMARFSEVFAASEEVGNNGAVLVGFLGRETGGSSADRNRIAERRIRRRERARRRHS